MDGRIIVIGASFNGIAALCALVAALPAELPAAVLVVQHTSPDGPGMLPAVLSRSGPLPAEQALIAIEARLHGPALVTDGWNALEAMSRPSGLNCPQCRSALYELPDPRLLRYRCRAGHAFSARGLLAAQAEARESLLASLLGALTEECRLARRWAESDDAATDVQLREHLEGRIARLTREASHVCDWLAEPPAER